MEPHDRLKLAREKAGYQTAALAANAIGVAYGTYASHENGNRGIKRGDLARYAKFFRVNTAWIAFGSSDDIVETSGPAGRESLMVAQWTANKLLEMEASQSDLAASLGLDKSAISKVLKGLRMVSLSDLFGIAAFFDIQPSIILSEIAAPAAEVAVSEHPANGKRKIRSVASVREGEALVVDLQEGRRISRPEANILRRAMGAEA